MNRCVIMIPQCKRISEIELINNNDVENHFRDLPIYYNINNKTYNGYLTDSNIIISEKYRAEEKKNIYRYLPNNKLKLMYNGSLHQREMKNQQTLRLQNIKMINFRHFNEIMYHDEMDRISKNNEIQRKKENINNDFEESVRDFEIISKIKNVLKNAVLAICVITTVVITLGVAGYIIKVKKLYKTKTKNSFKLTEIAPA